MTKTTHETLLHVVYRNGPDLLNEVEAFIARGEDLDAITEYGESALRVASYNGRFDVVLRMLAAGAAEYQLEWTETMQVLVRGTLADLADRLAGCVRGSCRLLATHAAAVRPARRYRESRPAADAGPSRRCRAPGKTPLTLRWSRKTCQCSPFC
ncbi:MAG: hypothetical protein IPN40_15180 [Uliginosibacterium sp.]|nr:hypothetical protein [Uliginosibacterium sp.]